MGGMQKGVFCTSQVTAIDVNGSVNKYQVL